MARLMVLLNLIGTVVSSKVDYDYDLVSCTTYVLCVNFEVLETFHGNLFNLRDFVGASRLN